MLLKLIDPPFQFAYIGLADKPGGDGVGVRAGQLGAEREEVVLEQADQAVGM